MAWATSSLEIDNFGIALFNSTILIFSSSFIIVSGHVSSKIRTPNATSQLTTGNFPVSPMLQRVWGWDKHAKRTGPTLNGTGFVSQTEMKTPYLILKASINYFPEVK
jgi:hypothetical protein